MTVPRTDWIRVSVAAEICCARSLLGTLVGAFGAAVSSGGGAVIPLVGISPAIAERDRTQANALDAKNRLMV